MAKGHREQPRQGLGQQRLARPGGPDEQDVRLLQLDLTAAPRGDLVALVVVVDGDGEALLGLELADHVLVEEAVDLDRLGKAHPAFLFLAFPLLGDDVQADVDALVADVDGRAGDELAHIPLALVTEGALQPLAVLFLACGI